MKRVWIGLIVLVLGIGGAILLSSVQPCFSPREQYHVVTQWGKEGAADVPLHHPMGIAWGGGFLYVADAEDRAIVKIDTQGRLVARWRGFQRPVAVATDGAAVYVADFLADRIVTLRSDGTRLTQWGRHGQGPGEFDAPSGVAVTPGGEVFVTDFYGHRVQRFSAEGRFLSQWGEDGHRDGQFHYPTDVTVNARQDVFVADAYNHRIQKFSREGRYLAKWGGLGYGLSGKWPGWFRLAKAVAVDTAGAVYVADAFNHRVQKFTGQGALLTLWGTVGAGPSQVHYAAGVTVDDEGFLYVSDFFNDRVLKLAPRPSF